MNLFAALPGLMSTFHPRATLPDDNIQIDQRLAAAVDWIVHAHEVCGGGGISKGYDVLRGRWAPAYPETTGYTIPTLLNVAKQLNRPDLRQLAISLADFLTANVTPEGGVAHWQDEALQHPVVFDTGQVIFGWLAAFEASGDARYLEVASRAGDWLAAVQDESGAWTRYQHLGVAKVIDTRVAWSLLRLYSHSSSPPYRQAAIGNLEWALLQQDVDGWFRHCSFTEDADPFTHTIAYTAEGLLECGELLGEQRFVEAAALTAGALLGLQRKDGSLASTYGRGWRETSRSSCLTGNCQVAHLWLRLHQLTRLQQYLEPARQAIRFVASTQNLSDFDPDRRGAIAGSWPLYGRYERLKYPNWAAKFYVDALLLLECTQRGAPEPAYRG